ncbi:MAG: hypothetical protein JNM89_04625 [Hyphomicrobiaceae bacterium]|nr:hypothetical protein [Hyphomicrobiaceae bacterium]
MENARCRGSRYAVSALRHKRASIASEIIQVERKLQFLKSSLVHVDATLKLLDPDTDPEAIPNKRPPQRIRLFRQGELSRLVFDALRRGPETGSKLQDIVSNALAAGGHDETARPAVAGRVRSTLAYLEKSGKVRRSGKLKETVWVLV